MEKQKRAFTLVELLVVVTILAIISVVAYQNFGGAVDKAVSSKKISDVSTIETALQQFKADKNYFPPTDSYGATNLWGYSASGAANRSNTIKVIYNGQEVEDIVSADTRGGGIVRGSGSLSSINIGFKGTISQNTIGKKYLTKDLYDPELGDIKLTLNDKKMIDYGVGRYVYAIYKKGGNNTRGNDYNIAYTIKKENSDEYSTRISGSYSEESCYSNSSQCPETLIGDGNNFLTNGQEQIITGGVIDTTIENQGIPYPVGDFSN